MEIREAKKDELRYVLELQYLAYQSEAELYDDFSIPPLTQTLEQLEAEATAGICLVAEDEGHVVGSVRGIIDDGICRIGRLIVHPAKQSKGIGSSLMQFVEKAFSDAIAFEVFTGTKSIANIRLYKKLGYIESKKKKLNEKITLLFLEKVNK